MSVFLLGKGKVGTAFSKYFNNNKISFTHCKECTIKNESGIIFIAINDREVSGIISNINNNNPDLNIIHFSASTIYEDNKVFLLHPYSSVSENTDISEIIFTLWGNKNDDLENEINLLGIKFIYSGALPSPYYHISAVIAGNFTQYFFLAASEILKKEGFSDSNSKKLITQLINSSIKNCTELGIKGISGPASRKDFGIINMETGKLKSINEKLSDIFNEINNLISKAVNDDTIF